MTTGISIHAPTRGTTFGLPYQVQVLCTFQSTLPRGERPLNTMVTKPSGCDFNPRSHEGNDPLSPLSISVDMCHFNPRSHEGNDSGAASNSGGHGLFQSTLPRGERRISKYIFIQRTDFNPRSHEGNDDTREETIDRTQNHFNPRSHEGNDRGRLYRARGGDDFNPRSHEGNDGS